MSIATDLSAEHDAAVIRNRRILREAGIRFREYGTGVMIDGCYMSSEEVARRFTRRPARRS